MAIGDINHVTLAVRALDRRRRSEGAHRRDRDDQDLEAAMSRKSIQVSVLRQVVASAGQHFSTNDISEDDRMLAAHPELASHSHYHAFVGGALSDHHVALAIVEVQKGTSRGSRWQKQG
ncbi:hypothetical protein WMF39_48190 [Sorangium sp. So ce1504]|uniref:hypothetical protein n=1 Tax=unclassified Sorangium TaxID=2621164 RepID=UPI003F60AB10